jgi:hypothetical protein
MNKKLPNLYVNRIEKKLVNNDTVFYSALKAKPVDLKDNEISFTVDTTSVGEKVEQLFNSPNYVYKMNAIITLKDKTTINTDIIGQMDGKLITIDEDMIDINDVRDIKF